MDKIDETSEEKKVIIEDADYKLRLLKRLDEEGDKDPDDIDIEKVDKVLNLLDTLSSQERPVKDDKEQFARMMRDKYGLPLVEKKKRPLKIRVMRAAAAAAIFFAAFMTVNFATAKAFDFSIIQWVKRTVSGFYFEFEGDELEKDKDLKLNKEAQSDEYEAKKLHDIEELKVLMDDIYLIQTREAAFKETEILYNRLADMVDIRYEDGNKNYISLSILRADGEGGGSISVADDNVIEDNVQINNFTVTICESYNKDQSAAIFTYKEYLYTIDTNFKPDKLKEIISKMEKIE